MSETWTLGAYWGARQESDADCAARLHQCWEALGRSHGALGTWYLRGNSRAEASTPVGESEDAVRALVVGGASRTDFSDEAMPQLGFSVGVWNGSDTSFSARLGAWSGSISNNAVLQFRAPNGDVDELLGAEGARQAVEVFVQCFDPAWVTLRTAAHVSAQPRVPGLPKVGWLTWLGEAQPRVTADHPAPILGGWLYAASPSAVGATDERIAALHAALFGR